MTGRTRPPRVSNPETLVARELLTAPSIELGERPRARITGDRGERRHAVREPSSRFLTAINAPPIAIGPLYAPKTIDQCIVDDPICTNDGGNVGAHGQYVANGMVDQAAVFAAQHL